MVSSSKKKRGQQRKAARSTASNNNNNNNNTNLYQSAFGSPLPNSPAVLRAHNAAAALIASQFAKDIKRANNDATHALVTGDTHITPSFSNSGILLSVLNFLKRCQDETFHNVLTSVQGNLGSPSMWICVLEKVIELEPSCTLQIAENIGPLVSSMCNDTERLFFKSNKHWRESILHFAKLLFEIVFEGKKEVVEIMIKHEGFLSFVVQCSFWGEEHRPDIVEVLSVKNVHIHIDDELGAIVGTGRAIMKIMAMDNNHEDSELLEVIGMMPIVSKVYNPSCTISFVEGFVRRLNISEWDDGEFRVLHQLIVDGDCVDRGLIKEVIGLCLNACTAEVEYTQAVYLTMLPCTMMFPGTNMKKKHPNDTRVAFAIRAGLIEVCLGFIEYFGGHETYGIKIDRLSMFDSVGTILKSVYDISLHQKTAKAIDNKNGW